MEPEDQEREIEMQSEPIVISGGAVNSVNGKTGDVVLTTSDLENDSGYQTGTEVDNAISTAVNAEATARENADNNLQEQIDDKQDTLTAGENITIENNEISATDTTYTAGTGIDITNGVISTTSGGGPTVVQTTGTSTTDVMSQDATSSMVYADPGTDTIIKMGSGSSEPGTQGILIGYGAYNNYSTSKNISIGVSAHCQGANTYDCIALGEQANAQSHSAIAIGRSASVGSNLQGSIALGAYSTVTRKGEINVGTSWNATGFNNTAYRVIGGVHDGQDAHDCATVGQINATIDAINSATGSSIPHVGA